MDQERSKHLRAFLADPNNEDLAQALWHWTRRFTPVLDGRAIDEWLADLESDDWTILYKAVTPLKILGPGVLWPVKDLLAHPHHYTRWGALLLLENMGPAAWMTFPKVCELVKVPRDRGSATRVIGSFGRREAFDFLHGLIATETDRSVVSTALHGFSGHLTLGPGVIASYLTDERRYVVADALEHLGHMGAAAKEQVPLILPFLKSPRANYQKLAKRAVKRILVPKESDEKERG